MQRAHKIRLKPTKVQEVLLRKTAGSCRFAYNWAKAEWDRQYEEFTRGDAADKPSVYPLCRQWTTQKPEWAKETYSGCQTKAILNLGKAMINFWNKRADKPSFKKKRDQSSFYVANDKGAIKERRVRIPRIGWVKMRESLRFEGKILGYTVSHRAGQWHVSVQVEMPDVDRPVSDSVVGVDVGIKSLAVASDGTECENPRGLKLNQKRLRRYQRRMARRKKGSNRRAKTKTLIAKTHLKITNVRNDRTHKFTTALAKNHGKAVVETLSVSEMKETANKGLRRNLQDTAMAEVHRQLEYKMGDITFAPRYYPSSKTCSVCGHGKKEFPCSVRTFSCEKCGLVIDRDLNAAYNLKKMPWVTGSTRGKGPKGSTHREAVNPT